MNFITPSAVRTWLGSFLMFEGSELTHVDDPLFVEDADGEVITRVVVTAPVTFVTREDGSPVALRKAFTKPWHTGETATPFSITVRHQDGTPRTDIAYARFTLVNVANDTTLIDAQPCQTVVDGVLAYRPSAGQMATACLFSAQFTATLDTGYVLPSFIVEGEIEASL